MFVIYRRTEFHIRGVTGYRNKAENKPKSPCGRHFLISPSTNLLPQ